MSSAAVVNVAEQELRWLNIGHAAEYGHIVKAAFQGACFSYADNGYGGPDLSIYEHIPLIR
jgi:hypothetical protein